MEETRSRGGLAAALTVNGVAGGGSETQPALLVSLHSEGRRALSPRSPGYLRIAFLNKA